MAGILPRLPPCENGVEWIRAKHRRVLQWQKLGRIIASIGKFQWLALSSCDQALAGIALPRSHPAAAAIRRRFPSVHRRLVGPLPTQRGTWRSAAKSGW